MSPLDSSVLSEGGTLLAREVEMATALQIAEARLLVAEPDEDNYTEQDLNDRIDAAAGDLDRVAYDIWMHKAARFTELVSISEAGSSRSLGELHAKAIQMAEMFKAKLDAAAAVSAAGTRIKRLRR